MGSTSIAKAVKLILESLSFGAVVNTALEAKLRPKTSVDVVKLAPICSISRRCPAETISRFRLFNKYLAEKPYFTLSSLKP